MKKEHSILKRTLFFLLLILVGAFFSYFVVREYIYKKEINSAVEFDNSKKVAILPFLVKKNQSLESIASELYDQSFIQSKWLFELIAERQNLYPKSGKFYIPRNLNTVTLLEMLQEPISDEIKLTIPEGFTINDIDKRLSELGLIKSGEFNLCIKEKCNFSKFLFLPSDYALREGFFFPDTYFVNKNSFSVEIFAHRMLSNFDRRTKELLNNKDRNGWDILKMASIIEKESRNDEERSMVAGILWKRFDNKIQLGADATTRYVVNKKTEDLTIEDLNRDSPWNTRKNLGLPPGAICNPGLSSINAAVNPKNSEYFYYLHDGNGNIHYGKTLREHNDNKSKYLQ